jgi:hypothetical protein
MKVLPDIDVEARHIGSCLGFPHDNDDNRPRNVFEIKVTHKGVVSQTFPFYDSISNYNKHIVSISDDHLPDVLNMIISDALMGMETFSDFSSECGCDTSLNSLLIYLACQDALSKLRRIGIDLEKTQIALRMRYDL